MKPVKTFQIGEETLDIKDQTAREKIEKLNGFETVIDPDTGRAVGYKTTAGGNTVFPIPTLYDATGNNSDGAMSQKAVTDAIQPLSNKIQSFEDTKSEIASSGLGVALGLAISNTWAQIVAKLKTVVNRGAVNATISTSGGSYTIPEGFHNGSGKVTGPTLAKLVGSNVTLNSASSLLSGVTAYGKDGTKYTGTNDGYSAGYSAGQASMPKLYKKTINVTTTLTSYTLDISPTWIIGWSSNGYVYYYTKTMSAPRYNFGAGSSSAYWTVSGNKIQIKGINNALGTFEFVYG